MCAIIGSLTNDEFYRSLIHFGHRRGIHEVAEWPHQDFGSTVAICRYRTSGKDGQPIVLTQHHGLVMNGVISQAPPSDWPGASVIEYQTDNDAEIAARYSANGIRGAHGGSFACCEVLGGDVLCWRNGERPLWVWGGYAASTKDMFLRASKATGHRPYGEPTQLVPGEVYSLREQAAVADFFSFITNDLQQPYELPNKSSALRL